MCTIERDAFLISWLINAHARLIFKTQWGPLKSTLINLYIGTHYNNSGASAARLNKTYLGKSNSDIWPKTTDGIIWQYIDESLNASFNYDVNFRQQNIKKKTCTRTTNLNFSS